ncbi:hypothetical protein Cci01nite_00560 [Catellatospora citrea]|uniref:Uncharacterized protein n=2 Tax=Catellatospora citrea TaxID=53366 RepID=A0A8J3NWF3_9ACTN|nr:hypothetical protein Cci01nite_00560 [Catellatospora citrea]
MSVAMRCGLAVAAFFSLSVIASNAAFTGLPQHRTDIVADGFDWSRVPQSPTAKTD